MAHQPADHPALAAAHLHDARLFASRKDMLAALPVRQGGVVGEVGVGPGDLSELLLDILEPSRFVAFDTFTMHEYPYLWADAAQSPFRDETQLDFYRRRFSERGEQVAIERGWGHVGLARYPDRSFDLIALDPGNDYQIVKREIDLASEKIKPDGVLMLARYMAFDHLTNEPCGVVSAVNELVAGGDWHVLGLALQREMFCDIAVRR
ncbi:MAG TPA: hypothetical protein VM755_20095 [Stellaceae bacterium]|nr:hypothetical protein [Stellaceae bacterium]